MEFFFPDSQDQVNRYFDFEREQWPPHRIRQRDDEYAHEVLTEIPYDGILLSKAMADGSLRGAGKYSLSQQQRLYRFGIREFFRLDECPGPRLTTMGDCGAFNYAEEDEPPYTVDEVIDFYEGVGLDRGISVDHIIFAYLKAAQRAKGAHPEPEWIFRRELTVQLAAEFFAQAKARHCAFEPVGAAHGWDPVSYQQSVVELQEIGYRRIAIGGLVPLRTPEIVEVVSAVADVRRPDVQLHLLGVTRHDEVRGFQSYGVTSFDSTSPFRQSFKDDTDNYYTLDVRYTALRIPQVDANPKLKRAVAAGKVDQRWAIDAERRCLGLLRDFDRGEASVGDCVTALVEYEQVWDGRKNRGDRYEAFLRAAPWQTCTCGICGEVGIEVAIFRGSERNKRRGFHNLTVFRGLLDEQLALGAPDEPDENGRLF